VVKGGPPLPEALRRELEGLRRSGFGGVGQPEPSPEGWRLRLRGLTLPGGLRTDALVLLPKTYPLTAPIGFYLATGAASAQLDRSHLFHNRAYHGAPDLSGEGWHWYCGVADTWRPGHHTLVSYLTVTLAFFAERNPCCGFPGDSRSACGRSCTRNPSRNASPLPSRGRCAARAGPRRRHWWSNC
jgi:hypothetical protein